MAPGAPATTVDISNVPRKQLPNIQGKAISRLAMNQFNTTPTPSSRNKRDAIVIKGDRVQHQSVRLVKECLRFWICSRMALDRDGNPLYVELAFADEDGGDPKQHATRFFSSIGRVDGGIKTILDMIPTTALQPVYIPADFAHPHGHFVDQLIDRRERWLALAVAFLGVRNPVLCSHCVKSYVANVSWNREHILFPFSACISIKGFQNSRCANCIWQRDTTCEWEKLPGYLATSATEGPQSWPLLGKESLVRRPGSYGVDQLNRASCPRVSCKYPSLRSHENGGVRELSLLEEAAAEDAQDEFSEC
ncbi:hypothetical protein NW757_014310 [Fusarium falciforme]|nr:hypothetical protein NW757_014310 [Fusarium falciforme]